MYIIFIIFISLLSRRDSNLSMGWLEELLKSHAPGGCVWLGGDVMGGKTHDITSTVPSEDTRYEVRGVLKATHLFLPLNFKDKAKPR